MTTRLNDDERRRRAARVRLILTDVDGVLTDGAVYYSVTGEELRRFHVRDGVGVELLRELGLETAFICRDQAPMVLQRARRLHVSHAFLGVANKGAELPALLSEAGVKPEETLYVGDDVDDVEVFRRLGEVGLTVAPSDARPEIQALSHWVTTTTGGHGVIREIAKTLRDLRRS
jgi:3-deoxy-D-manno-octulosonate 8-phosphate phosphatase (KDO 8-P phosphatase)